MTLNISARRRAAKATPPTASPSSQSTPASAPSDRALVNEVIDELTAWNPREFIAAFQRWHHGALSLAHLNVLTLIEAYGPLSMSRLAEALDISVASATGIVERMENRDLVERRHDSADRRVVLVHPAKGAKQVFGDINARRRKGLARVLDHLTDEELTGLLRGHRALRAARLAAAAKGLGPHGYDEADDGHDGPHGHDEAGGGRSR